MWQNGYFTDWFLIPRDTFGHFHIQTGKDWTLFKYMGVRADEMCIIYDSMMPSLPIIQEA